MMSKEMHGKAVSINKGNTTRAPKMALLPEGQTCFSKFSGRTKIKRFGFAVLVAVIGFGFAACDIMDKLLDDGSPEITTTSLPDGSPGMPYSQKLAAKGDTPITWSIASGSLPTGFTLVAGTINGTTSTTGKSTFTVKAENEKGSDTKQLSITIAGGGGPSGAPSIITTSLLGGTVGTAYTAKLGATGTGTITWNCDSGTLPAGLTLAATGDITGTPTTAGTSTFTVKATNSVGSATKELSITITGSGTPSVPTGVTAARNPAGSTTVRVQWTAVTGATSYKVYYSSSGSGEGSLAGSPSTTSYDSTGRSTTETHYFRVTAVNSTGEGASSAWVSVGPVSGDGGPGSSQATAIALIENKWADGTVAAADSTVWYKFEVTSGTTYRVWWNEKGSNGDGSKTADVVVGAQYSGSSSWIFGGTNTTADIGWDSYFAQSIAANQNGTVYLRVRPYNASASNVGTFGIVYTTGTNARPVVPGVDPPSADTLTENVWKHGTILTTDAVWYKFEVTSGTTYRVWWNNRTYGPAQNTKTGDVVVGARYAGSDTWIFGGTPTSVIGGWPSGVYTNPPSFTADRNGTVYVRVSLYNNNIINVGTFALVYSAGTTRPGLQPPAWTGSTTLTINNTDAWNEALTKLKGQTGQYTLTISGDIGVSGVVYGGGLFDAIPYSFGTTEDGFPLQVTLNGNGTLYTTAGSELFVCGAGQTVIIDSPTLTLDGRYGGSSVIRVYADGTLELKNGTITGAHGSIAVSPGVIVYGGTFIMRGGKISGNGGESGGGVYVCPDLSSVPGTFTMYGGEISSNTVTAGNSYIFPGRGGGVYVYDATFTMHGGKIFGNTATSSTATAGAFGGGVCVYGASTGTGGNFTMLGGEIYGNTASGTLGMGGGVYVDRGTFRIVEGTIYGSDEAGKDDNDNDLKNTATLGAALYKTDNGTAQRGTFSGTTWNGTDLISSGYAIEDTIKVE